MFIWPFAPAHFGSVGTALGAGTRQSEWRHQAPQRQRYHENRLVWVWAGCLAPTMVADDDDALLAAPASSWLATCQLAFALKLRDQSWRLPQEVVLHPRPEPLVRRHFAGSEGATRLRAWLRRRLGHLLEYSVVDGEIELVITRLEWAFRDLPFFLAFSVVRLIANSWCTTRGMTRCPSSCLYGCAAVGGDDLRHYLMRPRLADAARSQGRRPRPWVPTGNLRVATLALPSSRADVRSACVWAYVAYRLHLVARHEGAPVTHIAFLLSVRAAIRAWCSASCIVASGWCSHARSSRVPVAGKMSALFALSRPPVLFDRTGGSLCRWTSSAFLFSPNTVGGYPLPGPEPTPTACKRLGARPLPSPRIHCSS